jgi:hypothetical protein
MDVFIVRPFGIKTALKEKPGTDPSTVEVNFDKVQAELIDPALARLKMDGGTTGKIFEAGDIREDMFALLLKADLVIADITIHNANVFYELGIRHALRDKKTVLIKNAGVSETPFDILGFRYVTYDREQPAEAILQLVQAIRETKDAYKPDSPVFKMLPGLKAQEYEKFIRVPEGFCEELNRAKEAENVPMLSLLAHECNFFHWRIPALRLVGAALIELREFDAARLVWEKIKDNLPDDVTAGIRLSTIYERLSDRERATDPKLASGLLSRSDNEINELLADPSRMNGDQLAEVYSLKGRNLKSKWITGWKDESIQQKTAAALRSDLLQDTFAYYWKGYLSNLNSTYAGINALAMLTLMVKLIEKEPAVWKSKFESDNEAERQAEQLTEQQAWLVAAMEITIRAGYERLSTTNGSQLWLDLSKADFMLLSGKDDDKVFTAYYSALELAKPFAKEAVRRQLTIFSELGVFSFAADKVLQALNGTKKTKEITHFILFTGHMIDKKTREEPRLPSGLAEAAKEQIRKKIELETRNGMHQFYGIAGGACGGDILFHEVCAEKNIPSELYLALPADQYVQRSVAFGGNEWVDRFYKLYGTIPHRILCETDELPAWLKRKEGYDIWIRNTLFELFNGLVNGAMHLTVIALWDGKTGDGPGGTEYMVQEAGSKGAKVVVIPTQSLAVQSVTS